MWWNEYLNVSCKTLFSYRTIWFINRAILSAVEQLEDVFNRIQWSMYMGKHASPASLASTALRLSNDHRNILLEFLQIFPQIFVKILALQIFLGFLFLSRSCVIIIFFWICILLSCYRVLAEVRSENTLSAVFANTPLLFRWCCCCRKNSSNSFKFNLTNLLLQSNTIDAENIQSFPAWQSSLYPANWRLTNI